MKYIVILFILFNQAHSFAQSILDSAIFSNNFKLAKGIYTSLLELQYNSPKYLNCELDLENQTSKIYFSKLYYINSSQIRNPYTDAIFAYVVEGNLFIFHHDHLSPIFLRGAISTFILKERITTTNYPSTPSSTYGSPQYGTSPTTSSSIETNIYFFDFKTGIKERVNIENLDTVIKRDSLLYHTFKTIKTDARDKKAYSYVSQYNARNPVYILFFKEPDLSNE